MVEMNNKSKQDSNFGSAIDKIFDNSKSLNEIQSKIISLMQKYADDRQAFGIAKDNKIAFDEQKFIKNMTIIQAAITEKLKPELEDNKGKDGTNIFKPDQSQEISTQAKNDLKKQIKNFVIYEIYKVMNPKRIAGETAKDNYVHNILLRGEKVASKYEGGRPHEVKNYSASFKQKVQKQAVKLKNKGWEH